MQNFYRVIFVLLILSYSTYSIELSTITSLIVIPFCLKSRLSKTVAFSVILLFIIFLCGIFKSLFNNAIMYDVIKDVVYFLRPILMLLATYLIIFRINSHKFILNVFVGIGLLVALQHLLVLLLNLNTFSNITDLRTLAGKQNHIEVISIIILLFTPLISESTYKNGKIIYKTVLAILTISTILYFSRSMFIVFLIYLFSYKKYLFLGRRLLKGLGVISLLVIVFILVFNNVNFKDGTTHSNSFTYKIYNSVNELFESVNLSKIKNDKNELWEHWRAYEAAIAIDNVFKSDDNFINTIFGMGFGSNINLKTEVKLENKIYKEVPSIHNGYINIFYKTGFLGLIIYLFFILYNYLKSNMIIFKYDYLKSLFVGSIFYVIYNSFVITGFLRPGEFSLVILATALSLNQKFFKSMRS